MKIRLRKGDTVALVSDVVRLNLYEGQEGIVERPSYCRPGSWYVQFGDRLVRVRRYHLERIEGG